VSEHARDTLIKVENLKTYFPIKNPNIFKREKRYVYAVDNISFEIKAGETLGLVGESGCGKSTTGRTMLRLVKATDGKVLFKDKNVFEMSKQEMVEMRRKMQIIFQDPYASLNPRMTVEQIVAEAVKMHKIVPEKDLMEYTGDIIHKCGLNRNYGNRYPHEFSGGQRQRVGIARALALQPEFVVCDEPVSALDVSVRAQILNLMKDLQEDMDLTYLFISHDLSVVKHISDRVAVMYLGTLVELTDKNSIYDNPMHPYTQALLSAIPKSNPRINKTRTVLVGDIPSPANPPKGCKFHTRCHFCQDICKEQVPELREVEPGHFVSCHFAGKLG